jgi:hypothetical protein
MKKSELRDKIKSLVQQTYKAKSINLDKGGEITLDAAKFPVLVKFPKLKDIIVDLLTDQYEVFMKAIEWVAPRPTTFRIVLGNDENFMLIYTERSWIAQIEGKKYYLLNLSEEEMAAESISRLLAYGAPAPAEGEAPAEGTEEAPAEETPPAEEEEETPAA